MAEQKTGRRVIDWDAMEPDWRANIKSVLQMAKEHGVSHTAINKHFKGLGIPRDLQAKIRAKAEALVSTELVSADVSMKPAQEREVVETNARVLADTVLHERTDIKRARNVVNKLFAEVEAECDNRGDFERLGEILRQPDENNQDKLNDLYTAAISLPQRVKSAKLLADALKVLIELERKVLRIDDMATDSVEAAARGAAEGAGVAMSASTRSMLAELMAELDEPTATE